MPTTMKDAVQKWVERNEGASPAEAKEVLLYGQMPPIEKLDATLNTLTCCEKLSLSSNAIDKITNLGGLKSLRILSLGRNNIKNLSGLEAVGDTLEQLWISYNNIEKLRGITSLKKLRVLYMSNNNVKEWSEFMKLAELPNLQELVFLGNPLEEKHSNEGDWRDLVTQKLPKLKKLDGIPIVRGDDDE